MLPQKKTTPDSWLQALLQHSRMRHYAKKATIIYPGAKPETLYYIHSGKVSVVIDNKEGYEIVLAYLNRDEFFGEMGLFDEQANTRSAKVVALSPVVLSEINYQNFTLLYHESPDILFTLARQIASRLRNTSAKVRDLAFLNVAGRVTATLRELASQPDAITFPNGRQVYITRQEIARIVGCSREMAGRVLKELEECNLIVSRGKNILIREVPSS